MGLRGTLARMSEILDPSPQQLAELSENWQPENRAAMIEYFKAADKREKIRSRYSNVAELASSIDPDYKVTPAVDLVAWRIEHVLTRPNCHLLVTAPPQELKSTLCAIYTPLRALQRNPNTRIIMATYAESLALEHSRTCREIIARHGSGSPTR